MRPATRAASAPGSAAAPPLRGHVDAWTRNLREDLQHLRPRLVGERPEHHGARRAHAAGRLVREGEDERTCAVGIVCAVEQPRAAQRTLLDLDVLEAPGPRGLREAFAACQPRRCRAPARPVPRCARCRAGTRRAARSAVIRARPHRGRHPSRWGARRLRARRRARRPAPRGPSARAPSRRPAWRSPLSSRAISSRVSPRRSM